MKRFPHLAKDLKSSETAKFIGEVYVSENCSIGNNCILDASQHRIVIGKNCVIEENVKIIADNNSITIGENTTIKKNSTISKSIDSNQKITNN